MTRINEKLTHIGCCTPAHSPNESTASQNDGKISQVDIDLNLRDLLGGWFTMGADDGPYSQDGEGPQRQVFVDPFSISATAVSNEQFGRFVSETGYRTVAEELGWSFVFHLKLSDQSPPLQRVQYAPWWCRVEGACWTSPEGECSTVNDRLEHPVVHIALRDANAFNQWANCRLPTEAEWEFAARGGLDRQPFPWGSLLEPDGVEMSNVWKGAFPDHNTRLDGRVGTVPVTHFPASRFGLYNITGNVWEWTADRFTRLHSPRGVRNPKGPLNGDKYVAKGGSYLCHASYCARYRTSSRQALNPSTVADNIGFRVVGS
ncbi:MAG: formylglycine-generating enzyme family protein [Rhizobiaceae bacterium]